MHHDLTPEQLLALCESLDQQERANHDTFLEFLEQRHAANLPDDGDGPIDLSTLL